MNGSHFKCGHLVRVTLQTLHLKSERSSVYRAVSYQAPRVFGLDLHKRKLLCLYTYQHQNLNIVCMINKIYGACLRDYDQLINGQKLFYKD